MADNKYLEPEEIEETPEVPAIEKSGREWAREWVEGIIEAAKGKVKELKDMEVSPKLIEKWQRETQKGLKEMLERKVGEI